MSSPQPQIVYPQNPANSKTVLANVFGSILVWLIAKYGLGAIFDPDTVNQIATALALAVMGAANIVIRKYTSGALSFSAPLNQPPPQSLPTGTVAVTTPHPDMPGPVSVVALAPGAQHLFVPTPQAPIVPPAPQPVVVMPPAPPVAPPPPPPQI